MMGFLFTLLRSLALEREEVSFSILSLLFLSVPFPLLSSPLLPLPLLPVAKTASAPCGRKKREGC